MIYERPPSNQQRAIIEQDVFETPMKVIAGAGTGKTFVLAHRFVWLVTQRGLRPERILTLTFSNAAAAEMKSRIKALLRRNLPGWDETGGRLWIHTFHSFAVRIIAEHSYAAGLPPDPELMGETRQRLLTEELLEGLLAGDFADVPELAPDALADLGFRRVEDLREAIATLIGRAKCFGMSPDEFAEDALARCEAFYDALLSPDDARALPPEGDDIALLLRDRLAQRLDDRHIAARAFGSKTEHAELRKLYYTKLRPVERRENTAELLEAQRRQERAVIETARQVHALYQQRLSAVGALDFDDQVIRAIELLNQDDRRLGRELAAHFEYILIDEFQDTSYAQMELLRAVTCAPAQNGAPPRLMVVGDKKQSIYGWRNARPENMDTLLPFGPDDCINGVRVWWSLTENWRSDGSIVCCANQAALRAGPADPALTSMSAAPGLVVAVAPFKPGDGEGARHTRRREAAFIAEQILELVRSGPAGSGAHAPDGGSKTGSGFALGDIAVLMRKRQGFRYLKRALEERGIPFQDWSGVGFFDHPLARDALAWLSSLEDPTDSASLARLLQRQPTALTDRELFLLATRPEERQADDDDERAPLRRARPLHEALSEFVAGRDSWRSLAERDALPRQELMAFGEAHQTLRQYAARQPAAMVLRRVMEWVLEHGNDLSESDLRSAPQVRATFEAILAELADGAGREPALSELVRALRIYRDDTSLELPRPELPAEQAVQVMTVHRAKGLGFPIVFVMAWNPSGGGRARTSYDETWGLVLAATDHEVYAKQVCRKVLGGDPTKTEEARLWYVALTRAKQRLYVTYAAKGNDVAELPAGGPWGKDLVGAVQVDGKALAAQEGRLGIALGLPPLLPRRYDAGQRALSLPKGPSITPIVTSFTGLRRFDACPAQWWIAHRWQAAAGALADDDAHQTGAIGVCAHRLIARFYVAPFPPEADAAQIVALCQRAGVTDRAELARLEALFRAFRASCWAHLRPMPDAVEREIRLVREPWPRIELRGRVDLLLKGPRQTIIDFKTNRWLPAADLDWYGLQMCIYRLGLLCESHRSEVDAIVVHLQQGQVVEYKFPGERLAAYEGRLDGLIGGLAAVATAESPPDPPPDPPCEGCQYHLLCPVTPLPGSGPAGSTGVE